MTTSLKLKRSSVASAVPLTTSLVSGELSLNTYDGKLFFKKTVSGTDSVVTIQEISAGSGITLTSGVASVDTSTIQAKLVSGTNIKTINGSTILGSGDIVVSGGGGSGLTATAIKTSAYTAAVNELVRCDTTGGVFNVTFPSAPADGSIIGILDVAGTFATYAVTVLPNGKTVEGDSVGFMLDVNGSYESFIYTSDTSNWRLLETPSGTSSAFWNGFTGSGNVVLATNPTLVNPILGTPASGTLSNCTGYTYANLSGSAPTFNQNTTGTAAGLSATLAAGSGGTGLTSVGTAGNVLTSNGTTWSSQPAPISLPSQTGNATKYLTTDGTTASWSNIPRTVSVLKRDGTTVASVPLTTGYLEVLTRSSTTTQVIII
jgi:hypothetical protein